MKMALPRSIWLRILIYVFTLAGLGIFGQVAYQQVFERNPPVHKAVKEGDLPTVKKLLAGNPSLVNKKDSEGRTLFAIRSLQTEERS
jgi:hypothetical protein